MTTLLEICLEDLDLRPEDDAYVRCVALPGGEPGLALDRDGAVRWMPEDDAAHGLWVSADDQLVLLRDDRAGAVTVERGDRSVDAPAGKPVILLDQDLLLVRGRRLRVHVHGESDAIYEPEPIRGAALRKLLRTAAAAVALGSAALIGANAEAKAPAGGEAVIEVRTRPPAPMPRRRQVDCAVTSIKAQAKGPILVRATCPAKTQIYVGMYGQLLDPKTNQPLKTGRVKILTVSGRNLTGEAPLLTKPVAATKVRFMVRW